MTDHHRRLDDDLDVLRDKVLLLGGETEAAVQKAMASLVQRDSDLAREVLIYDDVIDKIELEIDELAIDILALFNPAARDLRLVITAVKLAPTLERIADHACNIARHAIDLNDEPQLKPYIDLPAMAELALQMLRSAMDAFAMSDASAVRGIITQDDRIDALYRQLIRELLTYMIENPKTITQGMNLLFVAKHLERIADYVTNIAEQIVYMVEGRVIKHMPLES
ncbi:MAG: phosphate signaling complex protein PhoU [Acidobacteriota bacterium]|nr:phosphate signaling complex protein PhoU [Blastocatellia bacterium]MDW8238791.1 phosphate signaling complex protein PhoU [Acidobacteriota bacterium]